MNSGLYFHSLITNNNVKMTIYRADQKANIYFAIGFIILFDLSIVLSSRFSVNDWPLLIIIPLLLVVFNIFALSLNEVWLDKTNNTLKLIYKNYIGVKRMQAYDLEKIEFTYKREAASFRGGIKNVCTIYFSDKKVIQLVPGNDNWSDTEIKLLVYGLLSAGVKKKFVGYNLKDADM